MLDALRRHMAEHADVRLNLHPRAYRLAPIDVARQLVAEPDADDERRAAIIADAYELHPIAGIYPDLTAFEQAIIRAEIDLQRTEILPENRVETESVALGPDIKDRDVKALFEDVWKIGEEKLRPRGLRPHPIDRYEVDWTSHPVTSYWAQWRPPKAAGKHRIDVNCRLRTTPEIVSDEVLRLLLWHELVHSVTIAHAHDDTFLELEEMWDAFLHTNANLDALEEINRRSVRR